MSRTDDEMADLCHRILLAAAPATLHESEVEALVDWIEEAEMDAEILRLFSAGKVSLRWKDDGLTVTWRARPRAAAPEEES